MPPSCPLRGFSHDIASGRNLWFIDSLIMHSHFLTQARLMDINALKKHLDSTPAFILDEEELARSLGILSRLRQQSGVKALYSIKSLPLSRVLELAKPFVDGFSASSLFEALQAKEILAGTGSIHLTTPGINFAELDQLLTTVSHLSFNSLSQLQRYHGQNRLASASIGLRVNPQLSYLDDDRYNPCRLHSKLGVPIDDLWQTTALNQVQGLHLHTVFACQDYRPLTESIAKLVSYFGKSLKNLEWINLGGGYLFNNINNHQPFIDLVGQLGKDYALEVYVEPGKAIVGDAACLVASVIDCFSSDGKTVAVLDTSVNHNPEVFEYGWQPQLHEHTPDGHYSAILAGRSCLAGDLFGEYRFKSPLQVGDKLVFTNMGAYSLVKANRFNGINLPTIYGLQAGRLNTLKEYSYQDYRQQWLTDN